MQSAFGGGASEEVREALFAYGVEIDEEVVTNPCARIGNMALHKTLPVQSGMRGCLLADDGKVNKWLDPLDWTNEPTDGSQGQVMVYIPTFYIKFEDLGLKKRIMISDKSLKGYLKWGNIYVSAYEATLQRSTLKLSSVKNTNPDFRGGNNDASKDSTDASQLGTPATNISLTQYRTYARNRGAEWNCMTYQAWKAIYWLFVVEYATLNSQMAYNAEPTSEGFRQGGLGNGVTDIDNTRWQNWNGRYPFVPCGHADSLGNRTGQVAYDMPSGYGAVKRTYTNSYRGIQLPFGHIWKWVDGILANIQSDDSGGRSIAYTCDDTSKYASSLTADYNEIGDMARVEQWVRRIIFGTEGDILCKEQDIDAGSGSRYFDYFYTNIPSSGVSARGFMFSGAANCGTTAGLACSHSTNAPSTAITYLALASASYLINSNTLSIWKMTALSHFLIYRTIRIAGISTATL